MLAELIKMPLSVRLECSECGAAGEGSCNCGAPYAPAGARAAKAVAVAPEKSNRALAKETGVSKSTIHRIRASGVPNGTGENPKKSRPLCLSQRTLLQKAKPFVVKMDLETWTQLDRYWTRNYCKQREEFPDAAGLANETPTASGLD